MGASKRERGCPGMNEYIIKQKCNRTGAPPNMYSKCDPGYQETLYIARTDGHFGIIRENGELFLPFEYDNISIIDGMKFLLVKDGKFGLLHCNTIEDKRPHSVTILSQIPCAYDLITVPKLCFDFILLREDQETTSRVQIYYTESRTLSLPYRDIIWCRERYIIVQDVDKRQHLLGKNGEILFSVHSDETRLYFTDSFETCMGTVLLFQSGYLLDGIYDEYDDTVKKVALILIEKVLDPYYEDESDYYLNLYNDYSDYAFDTVLPAQIFTFDEFVCPILSGNKFRAIDRYHALGFIVKKDEKTIVLDGSCTPMWPDGFQEVEQRIHLKGITANGFPLEITI